MSSGFKPKFVTTSKCEWTAYMASLTADGDQCHFPYSIDITDKMLKRICTPLRAYFTEDQDAEYVPPDASMLIFGPRDLARAIGWSRMLHFMTVRAGSDFLMLPEAAVIDWGEPTHLKRLIRSREWTHIYHCAGGTDSPPAVQSAQLAAVIREMWNNQSDAVLTVITQGAFAEAHDKGPKNSSLNAAGSALWATVKMARMEMPRVKIHCIDVDPSYSASQVASAPRLELGDSMCYQGCWTSPSLISSPISLGEGYKNKKWFPNVRATGNSNAVKLRRQRREAEEAAKAAQV